MLIALSSFIADDPYGEIRVIRGRTHIAEDSDLAVRYPDRFEHAPGSGHGARERILATGTAMIRTEALPTEPRLRERWRLLPSADDCQRSHRPSRIRVRLAADAREQMLAEVRRRPEVETGGVLCGHLSHALIEVLRFVPPGPRAVHGADHYGSDVEHDLLAVAEMRKLGLEPIGTVHSHPRSSGEPSPEDLRAWAAWREIFEQDQLLGLIVVRLRTGESIEAWTVRRGAVADVCEPARLLTC